MNKKRRLGASLFLGVVFLLKLLPLISAYPLGGIDLRYGANQLIDTAIDLASPFFEVLIGDYSGSEFFFAKCLLMIVIYIAISFSLSKTKVAGLDENKGALFIISLAISILAIRYIPETDVIRAMILPYSALGIALSVIFPFLIFGFFLHKSEMGAPVRRLGWILYIIIFIVLWNSRSYELSPLGNQIYGWLLVAAAIMLIFDKQIHNYLGISELRQEYRDSDLARAAHYVRQAEDLEKLGTPEALAAAKKKRKDAEKVLSR